MAKKKLSDSPGSLYRFDGGFAIGWFNVSGLPLPEWVELEQDSIGIVAFIHECFPQSKTNDFRICFLTSDCKCVWINVTSYKGSCTAEEYGEKLW